MVIQKDRPVFNEASVAANDLLKETMNFVRDRLSKLGFNVVQDIETEEPFIFSAGKSNGHGRLCINFYFKKRE